MMAEKKPTLKPGEKSVWLTLTDAERDELRVLAATRGQHMSQFVRCLVRRELRKSRGGKEKKNSQGGDFPH